MVTDVRQGSFNFYGIERIVFRSLDTGSFLKSVILKHQPLIETKAIENERKKLIPSENVVSKTMKVPWGRSTSYS